jgi:hypothetical protein
MERNNLRTDRDRSQLVNIGALELALLVLVALPIWGIIDAAVLPDSDWEAASQNKVVWVLVMLFLSILGTIVYALAIRPQVRAAGRA